MLARVGCLLGHVSYFEEGADRLLHFHRLQPLGEDAAFEAHPFHDFIALAKPQQPLRFAKRFHRFGQQAIDDLRERGVQRAGGRAMADEPECNGFLDAERFTEEQIAGGSSAAGEAGQEQVDRIFGALRTGAAAPAALPKGHSAPTADLIRRVLRAAPHPLSAHEVAERAGLSRSTAQRYLKHLEQAGRLRLTLKYGDTGRPEHRYAWAGQAPAD